MKSHPLFIMLTVHFQLEAKPWEVRIEVLEVPIISAIETSISRKAYYPMICALDECQERLMGEDEPNRGGLQGNACMFSENGDLKLKIRLSL